MPPPLEPAAEFIRKDYIYDIARIFVPAKIWVVGFLDGHRGNWWWADLSEE